LSTPGPDGAAPSSSTLSNLLNLGGTWTTAFDPHAHGLDGETDDGDLQAASSPMRVTLILGASSYLRAAAARDWAGRMVFTTSLAA
jgi:hypothetical protein